MFNDFCSRWGHTLQEHTSFLVNHLIDLLYLTFRKPLEKNFRKLALPVDNYLFDEFSKNYFLLCVYQIFHLEYSVMFHTTFPANGSATNDSVPSFFKSEIL